MNILAIDTSTTSGSVAVVSDGNFVAGRDATEVRAHATWLLPAIVDLLDSTELTSTDIDLIAVGSGPGSFTGLRIAVSTVKGLAWSLKIPVCGVSTLKALAMNIAEQGALVCPVLDARKKEVYTALYKRDGAGMTEVLADSALSPALLVDEISARGERVVMLGSGLSVYRDFFLDNIDSLELTPAGDWHIRAEFIAKLAMEEGVESIGPELLTPLYKRKSEAEIKTKKK